MDQHLPEFIQQTHLLTFIQHFLRLESWIELKH